MFNPQTPGCTSKTHCRTSPGLRPPPHRSYQRPLDSVLPGQCRALNAICRSSQQGFAGRRPGAKPQPSPVVFPPGPKIQAPASSDLLIIPGPGKSTPQRALRTLLAGRAQHTPARDPEIGRPKRAPQSEARRGPEGRRPQQLYIPERGGEGAVARSSRRSGLPELLRTPDSSPSQPGTAAAPLLPHAHCQSQRARVTTGARPNSTDLASGRLQQPNPAHVMSLGSPGG
ncbi:hypothetical protein NDU88_002729 [Pleurodeles waltl]|uniref:Uncharacterized protein n=1 Tax=Pleurodeles waltl TaxID=8319 RepID=A0AAV7MNH6_PLEWA|nr:hypothetical protein NDU88_002729 [Pleurodeles waltl]